MTRFNNWVDAIHITKTPDPNYEILIKIQCLSWNEVLEVLDALQEERPE